MVKYLQVSAKEIIIENRFNPKYFCFIRKRDEIIESSQYNFIKLNDKDYFPILSDGIHSEVTLETKGKIKYLYVHSLKEGFIDVTDNIFLNEFDHEKNINKTIKDKYVLLSVVGTLGNTAMFSDYIVYECSLPRNIAYLKTNENKLLPEYLTCFFLSEFSKKQCVYSGGGNIQGLLSLTKLKKFVILVPPMSIQEQFAEQYNRAILLQKRFLEKIQECKQHFYDYLNIDFNQIKKSINFETSSKNLKEHKIFTPSYYNPYPDKLLAHISKKFELTELLDLVTMKKGEEIGSDNYFDYLSKKSDSVPFVRTSDIYNYEIDSYPDFYADKLIYEDLQQDFKEGDLILNNDGKIGFPAIITDKDLAIFQSHIKRLRPKNPEDISSYYLFLCLIISEIGQAQFNKYTVIQSTIPTLSNRINKIKVPILDENKRKELSDEIKKAFALLSAKKTIIRQIKKDINELINISET